MPLLAEPDRKLRVASAYAVSKIASFDFPEDWPGLVEDLLGMAGGDDNHVHGALRVLIGMEADILRRNGANGSRGRGGLYGRTILQHGAQASTNVVGNCSERERKKRQNEKRRSMG
jgi:hypothetical protein